MAKYMLKDVIVRANTKVDKDSTDLIYYVGGEHFIPGSVTVDNRGLIEGSTIGPMFYYGFKAGQFLLVSRNPHLKKAGVVDFDGICSEKTFVLETANPNVLSPQYLPFVLQNDLFWDYAIANRHGSTNFFINWATLSEYEFELPPLEEQQKKAKVLWALVDLKKKYERLLSKVDELVQAQFVELTQGKYSSDTVKLDEVLKQYKKTERITNTRSERYISVPLYGKGITERDIGNDDILPFTGIRIKAGQFVYSRIWARKGASGLVPKELDGAVVTNEFPVFDIVREKINPLFLVFSVQNENFLNQIGINSLGSTSKQRIKESAFLSYSICLPPLMLQNRFADFVNMCEVSKAEMTQAIDRIHDIIAAMM